MNILHFVGGDINSGSSKAVILLSKGLNKQKVKSKIFNKHSSFNLFFEKLTKNIFFRKMNTTLSVNNFGNSFLNSSDYKKADIIHLHWINKSLIKLKDIEKIDKPIVWTIRDMWPFTGICHYSYGCKKFIKYCGKCPQLRSNLEYDLSSYVFNIKKKIFKKKITFITNSLWINRLAKKSKLLSNQKILNFYNSIDFKNFKKIDKIKARKKLHLNLKEKIVLFGANNPHAKYKGLDLFIKAVNKTNKKFNVIIIGNTWKEIHFKNQNIKYLNLGLIKNVRKLNYIYASADAFVSCSIQDAFPKMPTEAMLSGTPCVYFKKTSIEEMNIDNKTGYAAEYCNTKSLAKSILKALRDNKKLGNNSRKHILRKYNQKLLLKKHVNLYKSLL